MENAVVGALHTNTTAEPPESTGMMQNPRPVMSIADEIEKIGHALTAQELARWLSVSKVTIFKQAAAGRIPSFRVGSCVRFDPRAIATWLRSEK